MAIGNVSAHAGAAMSIKRRKGGGGCSASGLARCPKGRDLHHPCRRAREGCGAAVAPRGGHEPVFGDVNVGRGDDARGETTSCAAEPADCRSSSEDQFVRGRGCNRTAVCRIAGP